MNLEDDLEELEFLLLNASAVTSCDDGNVLKPSNLNDERERVGLRLDRFRMNWDTSRLIPFSLANCFSVVGVMRRNNLGVFSEFIPTPVWRDALRVFLMLSAHTKKC
jgi:hypothetical protein